MASLKSQAEWLKRINLEDKINQVLFFSENDLIGYNQSQLSEGRNNLGNLINRYKAITEQYAEDPVNKPIEPKIEGSAYNFQWSGDFFRAFKVKQINNGVEITSEVGYLESIQRLGTRNNAQNKLFGLTAEHLREFIQKRVLPSVKKLVKETR